MNIKKPKMKNLKACFSHKSDLWKTPKLIYTTMMEMGCFDPCPENPKFDGLKIDWKQKNFVNPPYSEITKWIDKALEEAKKGNTSIFLVPARTDTKWFHKLIAENEQNHIQLGIQFVKGRLKFNDGKTGAPFPSVFLKIIPVKKYETD